MTEARPPAGWYQDSRDSAVMRYWDGAAWTEHVQPAAAPTAAAAETGTDADLRPDIRAAKGRMSSKFGGRRELRKLPEHLWDGESVERMATGTYESKSGLIVLTSRRLLFMAEGLLSSKIEDFPNEKISSVQSSSGLVFGTLTIFASGNKAEIKNVVKADLKAIADTLRARVSGADRPAAVAPLPTPATPSVDHIDQLRKLAELRDAGILTDAEFEAKKADVLSRM